MFSNNKVYLASGLTIVATGDVDPDPNGNNPNYVILKSFRILHKILHRIFDDLCWNLKPYH